jgi:N4-gp56 family major capsid protein
MSNNAFSTLSSDSISAYIAAKVLQLAVKELVLYGLCDKAAMQFNSGRTFQYSRYERVNLPKTALTEGVTPGDTAMSVSVVTAVLDQWGAVIPLTDVAIDSIKHPVLQQAISLGALQARETIEREVFKVLITGSNVFFPNAIAARSSLTSSDKISSAFIGKIVANMRKNGARPYDGDMYMGVVDPFAEDDMTSDSTFVDAAKYGAYKKLEAGEIGSWKGVRWVRSNAYPAIQLLTGASGATSATAGSLSVSTTYNAKLAVVDASTGHETYISAKFNAATANMGADTSVDITVPALPAGATAGSLFRLYFGVNNGVLYKAADDIAASSTYNQKVLPTSGSSAQVNPPSGIPVHLSFVFGKEGVACVELNKMAGFLTKAESTDSDPLVQRRKAGWKCDFKTVITNDLFLARGEHACTNN